jgi:hypothetical protein
MLTAVFLRTKHPLLRNSVWNEIEFTTRRCSSQKLRIRFNPGPSGDIPAVWPINTVIIGYGIRRQNMIENGIELTKQLIVSVIPRIHTVAPLSRGSIRCDGKIEREKLTPGVCSYLLNFSSMPVVIDDRPTRHTSYQSCPQAFSRQLDHTPQLLCRAVTYGTSASIRLDQRGTPIG